MRLLVCLIALVIMWQQTAAAHRLDEYLQATRIAVAPDTVTVEIDLAPGVSIAPRVLRLIDADEDQRIAPSELEAYARSVMRDLSLAIDGTAHALELTQADSSSPSELAEGTGAIRLQLRAAAGVNGVGTHVVRFENHHQRDSGVYLVNALVPKTRSIAILAQRRDTRQQAIEIDLNVAGPARTLSWLLAPFIVLGGLVVARLRPAVKALGNN